ncbi:MFS family permease [Flavobacterium arsenatis]|uniref:MFS family permease n=1 Tax=Flavobacterium arsenatis TaxID=1484332 RepID=A0ABU1TTJ3_9FLAO|nr:DUF2723 domain-containing protein [Flavobacterium arsenatis]MDR6969196.1 MFS family permease [Flavobacterium arsenatis]
MMTFNFKKWNTILGWTTFAIALVTYTLTVEPTLSFWDCGEYIATSAKLEVGHPPGAPLYQMIGAFFAMFATEASQVALMVNMMSVFSSAFTILFMFWSSTILLKKLISQFSEVDNSNSIVILGSAFVGSLAYTFSDSFWFNAVEAEVYAMASLLIAVLFWLGLRWEQEMETPRGNRWLLLISLVIGLSFGVHFMALLTIPSIGFLYYFKHYKTITIKNFIIANIVVVSVLLFIFKLLLPLTMGLFGKTEVFMVNSIGLPFDSGTIFVALLFVAFFYFGLKYTRNKGYVQINTLLLSILFILIGFSTWMMLPIRANANTVINENKPSDAREVLAYYNREQYGVNPLFYGPQFTDTYAGLDPETPYLDKAPNYERDYKTGKYVIVNNYKNAEQNSDDKHKGFLPRMWSTDHATNYMTFTKPVEFRINPEYAHEKELIQIIAEFRKAFNQREIDLDGYHKFLKSYGEYLIIEKPAMSDNLGFMFEYQFGYMYWRYLMWNFTGRQNDNQGKYDNLDGNWMSGVKFIDEARLGSQENLPSDVLNNKGRNFYFFLPFILGLIGLIYHANKDLKSFYVLLALFLFTGLALKIYLNERPFEPRERDYALVGSFYVFAIWIGFGVYAIYDTVKNWLQPKIAGPVIIAATLLMAPVLMASQNWDDHDRSGKYTALAMAKAYLSSCEPNAILFTIGDNDTFPLWYAQEIEGFRTDVRIVNTSLFMTDWYIDQMKAKAYGSEPMPISFTHDQYVGDKLDYTIHNPKTENRWDIKDFLNFIAMDDPRTIIEMNNGQKIHFYPTNKIRIPVDKNAVIANKVVSPKFYDSIVPYIDVNIKGQALYKNRLMMLDIVANNNWKRPIYFTGGSFGDDDYIWMKDFLQLDGMVYKLVPVRNSIEKAASPLDMGQIDSDKMYDIVMKWDWGNGESPNIYHDPETRKNSITYRTNLARLMEQLINEGKTEKAKKVIDLAMEKMPLEYYGFYTMLEPFAAGYYEVKETAKARKILSQLMVKYQENLKYYSNLKSNEQVDVYVEIITDIERYRDLLLVMKERGDMEFYNTNKATFNSYNKMFSRFKRDNE